jgi:C1A family cysteine protease
VRGLGYKRDVTDDRDHLFSAHPLSSDPIPPSASVDVATVAPKDQLSTSSCVGNSWAQALRLAYIKQGVECPELSALFVYRIARNLDGTEGDEGSQLRSGARAIQKLGCSPEASWPFSESKINDQLSFSAEHDGFDRDGKRRYYRIAAGDTDGVKRALAAGLPVVGGWDVSNEFCSSDGKQVFDVQDQNDIAGGHAIAIVGYVGDVFTLFNSWGPDWGFHNGRFHVTKGFIAAGTDLWALDITVAP